ncbi:MAG: flagellar filament capping protein FliD [Butyrivibrio sp.]|uniref:flagellar filament capping protein FliD n=1 Tax=Butyrivibrio sp. TaxID=28121 RepID=UPI0025E2B0AB|nr:flagellar filament capping protein FliD [Butyrivibrio sp.]MCR5772304.1 flagellar filament capping protein FliD [Butyrivibrio sp.]
MANNITSNGIYNHFLTSYASKDITKADSHKKDELKDIYKSIVRINKDSPLYLLKQDSVNEETAIAFKESARKLQGDLAMLKGEGESSDFSNKVAFSSNNDAVSATYIGSAADNPPSFDISVERLAQNQVNTGNFLPNTKTSLEEGSYFFDARIGEQNFEFQFSIGENDTNLELQQRISKLINKAGVALEAEVISNDNGENAIEIKASTNTLQQGQNKQFDIRDALNSPRHGIVPYFGIDKTTKEAETAQFTIGEDTHTSLSNHFTVASVYELELKDTTTDSEPIHIGVKSDNEALVENVKNLVSSYNNFLDSISRSSDNIQARSKMQASVKAVASQHKTSLESIGISQLESGHIELNEESLRKLQQDSDDSTTLMNPAKEFAENLKDISKEIMLDPMKFTQRPIVNYKNPGHEYANPYVTSEYSGMMFNNYC